MSIRGVFRVASDTSREHPKILLGAESDFTYWSAAYALYQ
jgi:hypothetical protein